jgi:hypothetical protein
MPEALKRVGRYDLLQVIGRGGAAVVYLARQRDLQRNVALKELAPYLTADTSFAERFVDESRLAGSMNHPNVVTVHEFFEEGGVPYIAMEYLPHGSLRQYIGKLTLTQIAGVLEGVLAGLSHGDSFGIVHRDLKPENLLVALDGRVKIADFGVARAYNKAVTRAVVTVVGTTIGTPSYMSPEQAMGQDLTPASDLYSLGLVTWEMLTGQTPFDEAETPVAVLYRQVHEPIPPVRSIAPEVDPALAAWLERMLEKSPEARFQTPEEAWEQLEEIVLELLGPRWRREARLVVGGRDARRDRTLSPAAFKSGGAAVLTPPPAGAPTPGDARIAPDTPAPSDTPAPEAAPHPGDSRGPGGSRAPVETPADAPEAVPAWEVPEPPAESPAPPAAPPAPRVVAETVDGIASPAAETVAPSSRPRRSFTTQHRIARRHREDEEIAGPVESDPFRRRMAVAGIVLAMIIAAVLGAVVAGSGSSHHGPTAAQLRAKRAKEVAAGHAKVVATETADQDLSTLLTKLQGTTEAAGTALLNAKTPKRQAEAAHALQKDFASAATQTAAQESKTTKAKPMAATLKTISADYGKVAKAATSKSSRKLKAAAQAASAAQRELVAEIKEL